MCKSLIKFVLQQKIFTEFDFLILIKMVLYYKLILICITFVCEVCSVILYKLLTYSLLQSDNTHFSFTSENNINISNDTCQLYRMSRPLYIHELTSSGSASLSVILLFFISNALVYMSRIWTLSCSGLSLHFLIKTVLTNPYHLMYSFFSIIICSTVHVLHSAPVSQIISCSENSTI